ncbi:MAG TPA: cation transporter dimerization domain-containing protein, partial [Anaerolineales bacterium]
AIQVAEDVSEKVRGYVEAEVERIVNDIPSLNYPHNIVIKRNRAVGNQMFISLECTVTPETPVTEAHELASALEDELRRRLDQVAEVSVHLEPPEEAVD